jgi:hypothetical protein
VNRDRSVRSTSSGLRALDAADPGELVVLGGEKLRLAHALSSGLPLVEQPQVSSG